MKRSLQEYVELVVFGLIALLVGTGLLWLLGWVLSLGGIVLKGLAGLLWMLLRFIVPVAIAGGLVYFLVKAAQDKQKPATTAQPSSSGSGATVAPAAGAIAQVEETASAAAKDVSSAASDIGSAVSDAAREVAAEMDTVSSEVELAAEHEPAADPDGPDDEPEHAAAEDDEDDAVG